MPPPKRLSYTHNRTEFEEWPLPARLFDWRCLALLASLLQACAQVPEEPAAPLVSETTPAPEIRLNLPEEQQCDCPSTLPGVDYTFLDRGFLALADGNIEAAAQHIERYLRLENSTQAQWESGMALAYIDSLASNPERNVARSRQRFNELNKQDWRAMDLHPQSLLLRQALQNFLVEERRAANLRKEKLALEKDLAKREETIKRLRELTLGQKGASP